MHLKTRKTHKKKPTTYLWSTSNRKKAVCWDGSTSIIPTGAGVEDQTVAGMPEENRTITSCLEAMRCCWQCWCAIFKLICHELMGVVGAFRGEIGPVKTYDIRSIYISAHIYFGRV